jgi:hypothetical protein
MYVAIVPNRSSPTILLQESYRDGAKAKNRTLANLSHWPAGRIETLRAASRGDKLVPAGKAGIQLNEHIAEGGPIVFAHACRLGAEGIISKRVDGTYRSGPCQAWIKEPDLESRASGSPSPQRNTSVNWRGRGHRGRHRRGIASLCGDMRGIGGIATLERKALAMQT